MNNIRVTYSGLISFGSNLISVVTGLFFILIITRTLSPEEFGTWSLISGLLAYAVIISPIVCFWIIRETARNDNSGKTGLITNSLFSILGVSIYLVISYIVGLNSDVNPSTILFGAILIPVIFIYEVLTSIVRGWKPHALNYGFLTFEISKVLMALVFIYYIGSGVEGAILATFLAYVPANIFLLFYALPQIQGTFHFKFIKKWLKLSWVPVYRKIPSTLIITDVVVFSLITGSVSGIAYFTAAKTIAYLVDHTRSIAQAMYPKLLEGGKTEFLQENLMLFFYLSFPLVSISIGVSKAGLYVLNPVYVIAVPAVLFLSLQSFFISLNSNFFLALQGIDKVDLDSKSKFKDYLKSKITLLPTFQLIRSGIYFSSLAVIFSLTLDSSTEIELITFWTLTGLLIELPLTGYLVYLVRKEFSVKLCWFSIVKYFSSSMGIFLLLNYLVENHLKLSENIFEILPITVAYVLLAFFIYIISTIIVDSRSRNLLRGILQEFKKN